MTFLSETIGTAAAIIGTICWLPQAIKTIRTRETAAISLTSNLMILVATSLWLAYGVMIAAWPLAGSNMINLCLVAAIVYVKLREDGLDW